MPYLFMFYKRGTSAVLPLIERLYAAHYRVWYDKNDISTGGNWREAIDHGIDDSDALLVALTPAACRSEFVQYEVKRALEQNKPIFSIKFEAIDKAHDPLLLGLRDIQFADFTKAEADTWNTEFEKLLKDMQSHENLQITRHTQRQQRGTSEHILHQRYLKKLAERIETFNLANISADSNATCMSSKLSLLLWQFPPSFKYNTDDSKENFVRFIERLPPALKHVVEFRHQSWFNEELYTLLNTHNIGFVMNDSSRFQATEKVTGDIAYIRFHGPTKLYASLYTNKGIRGLGKKDPRLVDISRCLYLL